MELTKYKDIIHRCFRCGYCKMTGDYSHAGLNCPLYSTRRFETCSPGGLMWLVRASMVEKELPWSERLGEILYSCTMCRNCVEQCRFDFHEDLVNILKAAREDLVQEGSLPPMVSRFLTNVYLYGNPYRYSRGDRGNWAHGTAIEPYSKDHEFLYYVGCVGSYDVVSQKAAMALGEVLLSCGVSFGILGDLEMCDGNEVGLLGEKDLFDQLKTNNTSLFESRGVKKIVTLSPHSYNAMQNDYPGEFEVCHYTQLLQQKVCDGTLRFSSKYVRRITYHDPCFLGRYNGEYEAPRDILRSIPGVELVEMGRNRENAFCCGGGGGNFYTDVLGGGMGRPSIARVKEALETGASVLAVACPICRMVLEDAVKTLEADSVLEVKDVSEIVREAL